MGNFEYPDNKSGNHKCKIIEETHRVGYNGSYYLIIPDHAAGIPGRYTVYKIPSTPAKKIKIIGRSLSLGLARRMTNNDTIQ